ncbi:hypothetical protein FPE01S_02_09540 [Flavihumibacter petaseus NBRC 106054]|uniref:Uncharacterized protein n=2 Tax=Flavihumibacter TaxID=1004301 RepID=A0A0E9N215_9BACT|nr:hypothetical protein FPE01S_02_09540 [Flavihumibacter petaseus NBRC 106054]
MVDQANNSFSLYKDDTATATLYDALAYSYQLNSDGFLVKCFQPGENGTRNTVEIQRHDNNQIKTIKSTDAYGFSTTTWFDYSVEDGRTVIRTTNNPVDGWTTAATGTTRCVYDANNKVVRTTGYSFAYQKGNMVMCATDYTLPDVFENIRVSYYRGGRSGRLDFLMRTILGKDYYIEEIRKLYMFSVFGIEGMTSIALSDGSPIQELEYQFSTGPNSSTEYNRKINFSYEYDDNGDITSMLQNAQQGVNNRSDRYTFVY